MCENISVIIPIYNVEEWLERCIKSVLDQTLQNIEIILVDDGSPDRCPAICVAYQKKYKNIKVIHKPNGGLASARNAGLKIAKGKYIFFLDSDDWLEPDGLEHLYEIAEREKVDFVRYRAIRTGWPELPENAPCMLEPIREMSGGLYDRSRILKEIYPKLIVTDQLSLGPILGAWGSLYLRSFLLNNRLFFYEDIRYSEDILFSASVIRCTNQFYYDDTAGVYHYFYNNKSISKSFKVGRWESCKKLLWHAEVDFGHTEEYDFSDQLIRLTWFCILLSLNERKNIADLIERQKYCKNIMQDDVVKHAKLIFSMFNVSVKQKMLMAMIKLNQWKIISRI